MFSGYGHFNFFYRIWDKLRIKFSDIVMKHSYKKCTKYELDCNNIRENKRLFRYINQEKKILSIRSGGGGSPFSSSI